MAFWKKKENTIIITCVVLFFVGLTYWGDFCCLRAANFMLSKQGGAHPTAHMAFLNAKGKPVTLSQFKGKPLIVNFWATWCPVCVRKMSTLNALAVAFEEQGGKVITISEDTSLGTVAAYFKSRGYGNLPIYLDSGGQLMTSFGVSGLPTSIFIDEHGKEVSRIVGGVDWGSSEVHDAIFKLFGIKIPDRSY